MKILALERDVPGITGDQFKPYLKPEAARVWELYQSDIFREMYFDKDTHNAVIIMECTDIEEARAALQTLPLVREGLIRFEVMALEPYSGFSRLFTTGEGK